MENEYMAKMQGGCCEGSTASRVEAVLSVDDRGQMVLPKDLRIRAGIGGGDKLAVISHERDGEICCISIIKTESLNGALKDVLGPVLKDVIS